MMIITCMYILVYRLSVSVRKKTVTPYSSLLHVLQELGRVKHLGWVSVAKL